MLFPLAVNDVTFVKQSLAFHCRYKQTSSEMSLYSDTSRQLFYVIRWELIEVLLHVLNVFFNVFLTY